MSQVRPNQVRARREAQGLTQGALAERAQLTRQSVSAVEAGRSTPGVDVALRIARALDCAVEDLFGAAPSAERLRATLGPGEGSDRVALALIGGRWVSHPLSQDASCRSADGLIARRLRDEVFVEMLSPMAEAQDNLVLMGCATGLGVLADRLNMRSGPGRFIWLPRSSTAALQGLARDQTHVAGVHLVDGRTGEANIPDVRRLRHREALALVTLARWEAGLVLRPSDRARIRGAADLGKRGLRLVARESGAGAQRLLERELRAAGLPLSIGQKSRLRASGHLELARMVAMGAGDTGIATRDVAMTQGLDFVPLAEERYDLAVPRSLLVDPRMARLLDVLVSASFRRELSALGYDVQDTGARVAEVSAS